MTPPPRLPFSVLLCLLTSSGSSNGAFGPWHHSPCTLAPSLSPPCPPRRPPPPQGLEDQLLGDVVRHEQPELEEALGRLVTGLAADRRQLGDLEDKVLRLLRDSRGNILDDEQLVATLNNAKVTSGRG
jgi:hypothetical protein